MALKTSLWSLPNIILLRTSQSPKYRCLKLVTYAALFCYFFYNVYTNFVMYKQGHVVLKVSNSTSPVRFPPVVICIFPVFDPLQLVSLGVNITGKSAKQLISDFENLVGIDMSQSGMELVEKAAWTPYDLVEEVAIGEIYREYYSEQRKSSSLWKTSYYPLGPCLTFTVPSVISSHARNLTMKLREFPPSLERCSWFEKTKWEKPMNMHDCQMVEQHCNVSCVWESFIQKEAYLFWSGLLPSTYLFYNLHENKLPKRIYTTSASYQLFPYIVVDNDLASNNNIEPFDCLYKLILRKGKTECTPMYSDTIERPLESLCVKSQQHFKAIEQFYEIESELTDLEGSCKSLKREYRWKVEEFFDDGNSILEYNFQLMSSSTLTFYKQRKYPISKLLENIGGSMGLFLGVSLLDGWIYADKLRPSLTKPFPISNRLEQSCHCSKLSILSGAVTLLVPFFLQCGLYVDSYIHRSTVFSISLIDNFLIENKPDNKNVSTEDVLLAYVSSRPLGCQLIAMSKKDHCFFQCILSDIPFLSVSSIYINDLPLCHSKNINSSNYKYVISKDITFSLSNSKKLSCKKRCEYSGLVSNYSKSHFAIIEESDVYLMDVLCSLGGTIGLYFGFSLLGFLSLIKFHGKIKKLVGLGNLLAYFVIFLCILFCSNPIQKYFFSHPIYTTHLSKSLLLSDLPALTFCAWPPFNTTRLLDELGHGPEYRELLELNSEDRHQAIADVIRNIKFMNNSKISDLHQIWYNSAWTANDLNIRSFDDFDNQGNMIQMNNSILNTCQTVYFDNSKTNQSYRRTLSIRWNISPKFYDDFHSLKIYLHPKNDVPNLGSQVYKHNPFREIKLLRISSRTSMFGSDEKPGVCWSQCLDGLLVERTGCLLPWMHLKRGFSPCNMTQFSEFLHNLWLMNTTNNSIFKNLVDDNMNHICKERCQTKSQLVYSIDHNRGDFLLGTGFAFHFQPDGDYWLSLTEWFDLEVATNSFEDVSDNDGYPFSQFVSEIGGIVGMTLGISLFSLLKKILQKAEK